MNIKIYILILLLCIVCSFTVKTALAQERVPGVSVGNEFTCSERSFWLSDPNTPQPAGLADVNITDYYRVTVTGVQGSNVSIHTRWHFTNGTDVEKDGSVSTETTVYAGGFWAIIGSNLNATDRVHPNSEGDLSTINETLSWNYGSYERQTNHLTLVFNSEKRANSTSPYTENVDTYFDRQTGALVQLEDNHVYSDPETILAVTWDLVSQNAWSSSDTNQIPLTFIVLAVVVAVLVIVLLIFLIFRRRR